MITFDVSQDLVPQVHRFTPAKLSRIARAVNDALRTPPSGVVTITFVDDNEIRRLNRMYREKDAVTDVLSFAQTDSHYSGYLGDILISYPQALSQAEDGDLELECTDLIVHGILHILGYDHERAEDAREMFPLQDTIVANAL